MNQSLYPALQAILPRLLFASPRRSGHPLFATQKEAEHYLGFMKRENPDATLVLTPVWAVNHDDLDNSEIGGWTVRGDIA